MGYIQDRINTYNNLHAVSQAQKYLIFIKNSIRKWLILKRDFSLQSGELTPTLKLKRNVVTDNYVNEIKEMYSE